MQEQPRPRVVVIGGGAAGVFTAYLLAKNARGKMDVTILERGDRVGGHTLSFTPENQSEKFNIDGGAQFFSETSEPLYCDMLREEKLTGLLLERSVGMTIWNVTKKKFAFRVPSTLGAILNEAPSKPVRWAQFLLFCLAATRLYKEGDWSMTFGAWLKKLKLSRTFKNEIVRPLMYQFGLVQPADLDKLSALFVVFFFVRSFPWSSRLRPTRLDASLFTVYNSEVGLDGILRQLIENHQLCVKLSRHVTAIERTDEGYCIKTNRGDELADEVVFAINPRRILEVLPQQPGYGALRGVLEAMHYSVVPAVVERVAGKNAPKYMPSVDFKHRWEVSNILVVPQQGTSSTAPATYMLGVWFGPMRKEKGAAAYFKAWGSPALTPAPQESVNQQDHELMTGTPEFMAKRSTLARTFQGLENLWFAGGYVLDYDSQESCLKSASKVARKLIERHAPTVLKRKGTFLLDVDDAEDPVTEELPTVFEEIAQSVVRSKSDSKYVAALHKHFHNLT